jgi:3-methyladenine DNA glycosylase AlkD
MRTSLLLLFAAALLTAPLANAADGRLRILFVGDVVLDGGPGHVITNGGDLCDQACTSLFDQTKHAWAKTAEWAKRDGEWQRRAGFALMAGLAWHDKRTADLPFLELLGLLERKATDERNFVKKAVNWALRNIGKRNRALNQAALACAERILAAANHRAGGARGGDHGARAARWVATDAIRELSSAKVRARLAKRTVSPA